jgi:hypothetical protein
MWNLHHPIWYNPHSLTPLLRILDTQVTRVWCMATHRPSFYRPEIPQPDVEVALMATGAGAVLRVVTGFVAPTAEPTHWFHLLGTSGEVETGRVATRSETVIAEDGLSWFADRGEPGRQPIRWRLAENGRATNGGHGGLDLLPIQDFVDSVLDGSRPLVDVYRAANVAAAGVLAGESAELGGEPFAVPDFRAGDLRPAGTSQSADGGGEP